MVLNFNPGATGWDKMVPNTFKLAITPIVLKFFAFK